MGFGEAFGTCLRKYTDFSGRARRSEFWWFWLAVTIIMIPFGIAFGIAAFAASADFIDIMEDEDSFSTRLLLDNVDWDRLVGPGLLLGAAWLFLLVPMLAVTARRLHDIGMTGWVMLVWFVPSVGSLILLVMCVIDGQSRDNNWGPDPKADERAAWRAPVPPTGEG
jgi:uncharacterized membrane protein YhaH (DUF805 family)